MRTEDLTGYFDAYGTLTKTTTDLHLTNEASKNEHSINLNSKYPYPYIALHNRYQTFFKGAENILFNSVTSEVYCAEYHNAFYVESMKTFMEKKY